LLRIAHLDAYYGDLQVLFDVTIEVKEGEVVTIVGANAAGKSSLIRSISGLMPSVKGEIEFEGRSIQGEPTHEIVELGIVQIPEARQLFPFMTVEDNLRLGAFSERARPHLKQSLAYVYDFLPELKHRSRQLAGSLSGGEQQMCAIGRGLMSRPRLLMLDEPSLGLAPLLVQRVFKVIRQIQESGTTILLVEQNCKIAMELASRAYVLENGHVVLSGNSGSLLCDERVCKAYLGM
jgi:branched-chain amino acid transport system ATP-binding protein